MAAPRREPEHVARVLGSWFERVRRVTDVDVTNVSLPESTGFSNETILFDAAWSDGASAGGVGPERHELVARVAPSSYQVFLDDTFELQFQVMRVLADTTVPTAAVHWFETDDAWFGKPFWIMERVHGLIPADNPPYSGSGWLRDATPDAQAHAWASGIEALAAIHNVPVADLGVAAALLRARGTGTASEIERYERFLAWAEDDEPHPLAREAIAWLAQNQPPQPADGDALVWGDARLSNVVYRDFEVVAVLDWEMTTIADPLLDLGWWIFADQTLTRGSGFERLAGFDSIEGTAARWANLTGRTTDALDYFLVFAGLRFTVIMLRMGKLLAEIGFVPPAFAYDNLVSQGLERQLRRV